MSARCAALIVIAAGATACGAQTSGLEARVGRLEREVAELKSSREEPKRQPEAASREKLSGCERVVDATVPDDTTFPYAVDYQIGTASTAQSDRILIEEVRGTRPEFERGGIYVVRGKYTLSSAPDATLLFSVTATQPGDGCTSGNERGSVRVAEGSGAFELKAPMPYEGQPHVTFYVHGANAGGVYFKR